MREETLTRNYWSFKSKCYNNKKGGQRKTCDNNFVDQKEYFKCPVWIRCNTFTSIAKTKQNKKQKKVKLQFIVCGNGVVNNSRDEFLIKHLTGNGALRTRADYSWRTQPYPPLWGWNELEQGQSLYCLRKKRGCARIWHYLVKIISIFFITERNIPEKTFRMEFITWRRSWKAVRINLLMYVKWSVLGGARDLSK